MGKEAGYGGINTEVDDLSASVAEVYANSEGNVCIKFNEKSFVVLTPSIAKQLSKKIENAAFRAEKHEFY